MLTSHSSPAALGLCSIFNVPEPLVLKMDDGLAETDVILSPVGVDLHTLGREQLAAEASVRAKSRWAELGLGRAGGCSRGEMLADAKAMAPRRDGMPDWKTYSSSTYASPRYLSHPLSSFAVTPSIRNTFMPGFVPLERLLGHCAGAQRR